MGKVSKYLLLSGLLIFLFGIASITAEIHGCFMCPIYGILYFNNTISVKAFAFLVHYRWYTLGTGVVITLLSLWLYTLTQPPAVKRIKFKWPKLGNWRQRRMYFHLFVYALILFHITLTILGITDLRGICPRTATDLAFRGQFGPAAIFWLVMLVMVFVWGRGMCGWLCVFAPVQEQSANFLKTFGFDPAKRKFGQQNLVYLFTAILLSSLLWGFYNSYQAFNFSMDYGDKVDSYWIFIGGVITFTPLTMFLTYYLGSRWFCKYLCPIGGTLSLYSKFSLLKVAINKASCGSCDQCTNHCQMGVNIKEYVENDAPAINDRNCIACGDCIDHCPKNALYFGFRPIN